MYTTSFTKVAHLPVSRNPKGYLQTMPWETAKPVLTPPPANFSEQRVRRAAGLVKRPPSAVQQQYMQPTSTFPMKLGGVAPADRVPVAERGTTPASGVRAFVSSRSQGSLLYQAPFTVGK